MTPPYDPHAMTWQIDEASNPFAMPKDAKERFDRILKQLVFGRCLEAYARAVIAAGRPHSNANCSNLVPPICPCPQCAAWDELKALLEKEEA